MFKRISVIGLGYIGLPTAALFARSGYEVVGVDIDPLVINTINAGRIHIVEPELDGVVMSAVSSGKLRATLEAEPADAFMIAVPTPVHDGHTPDISYVRAACMTIAPVLKSGNLVVLESTSPVGTTRQMETWLADARPDLSFPKDAGDTADVQIAYCPERVLPGKVVRELVENDRVLGGLTSKASRMAAVLYGRAVQGECIPTTAETAEMCKLVENSSRDVQIAFANELSMICEKFDVNVWELISLANRHPRVNILQPGAGVGGHCIAVDPWFIIDSAPKEARLIRMAREVNDSKPLWVLDKGKAAIADHLAENPEKTIRDVNLVCLGLAFKPDIDDLRESPAIKIVTEFSKLGCNVQAVEPNISSLPKNIESLGVQLINLEEALQSADILCVLVKHSAFRHLENKSNAKNIMIDVVGLIKPDVKVI